MTSKTKAHREKLHVTANSVYEEGAADGCRITCAYQQELWSRHGTSDAQVSSDDEGDRALAEADRRLDASTEAEAGASAASLSAGDFVGILQDAVSARKHLVLLSAMSELDKHEIAQRLGKFSPQNQEAWISKLSEAEQQRQRARRETLNPWVIGAPVVVDVWVLPWCDRADMMLQCQLAYMLSRDDFWTKHSYLRVCGVVGAFGQLGADDSTDGVTVGQRRSELYAEVWRTMRIPATIEVFDAESVAPEAWSRCREDYQAERQHGSIGAPGEVDRSRTRLCSVINSVIRDRESHPSPRLSSACLLMRKGVSRRECEYGSVDLLMPVAAGAIGA